MQWQKLSSRDGFELCHSFMNLQAGKNRLLVCLGRVKPPAFSHFVSAPLVIYFLTGKIAALLSHAYDYDSALFVALILEIQSAPYRLSLRLHQTMNDDSRVNHMRRNRSIWDPLNRMRVVK